MDKTTSGKSLMEVAKKLNEKYQTVEEEDEWQDEQAWDDASGEELKRSEVKRARKEEIEYVHETKLYNKVPISEAYQQTDKSPLAARWIDINKGDVDHPNYRSRLVAREINTSKKDDLFAATPPLGALKIVLSMTSSGNKGEIVMVNDISRALFHAPTKRKVYVQLPVEDRKEGEEQMCGRLNFLMYGTKDAATNWFEEYSRQLLEVGFKQVRASPCTFHHETRGIRTYVHGDAYVNAGMPKHLEWMKAELEKRYQVKTQMLGPRDDHLRQVKIANRIIPWDEKSGIGYEAESRHVEIITQQLALESAKAVSTPATKEKGRTNPDQDEPLDEIQTTKYKARVARCNYLSPDRPDIAFSAKELARYMAQPRKGD